MVATPAGRSKDFRSKRRFNMAFHGRRASRCADRHSMRLITPGNFKIARIPMDESIQRDIAIACIVLLQKNAADPQGERERNMLHAPKTKREAIELLLKAASDPDITVEH